MLRRVSQIFSRYAVHHGQMEMAGFALKDISGEMFGMLDSVAVRDGRLIANGWCFSDTVGLVCAEHTDQQVPSLARTDVAQVHDSAARYSTPGFSLSVPHDVGHKALWAAHNGERYVFELTPFAAADLARLRRKQIIPFMAALIRALPAAVRWYMTRDFAARAQIKNILGFQKKTAPTFIKKPLFAARADEAIPEVTDPQLDVEITIILPVYNAFDLLPDVLARVLAHTDLPYRMIIVEDKSSDPQVRPFLCSWHAALDRDTGARIEVLENAENLGFIRSVNRAFARALTLGNHVVLLNSDAFVPQGWASRLLAPLLAHDDVATVTPMSNDAEIFNVPVMCQRSDLGAGAADMIDAVAQRLRVDVMTAPAPTGVGFCMAMNIKYLTLEPQLDTVFGRGYGEEVDWCQRVHARGGRHLGHAGVFVEHRGGMSFGSEEKLKLVQANNEVISQRYAGYDQMVQDFIRDDPLGPARLGLALAWCDTQAQTQGSGPVPVYLAHDMGGGAEHYLERRIAENLQTAAGAVVIRVGGLRRWKVEVHSAQGSVAGAMDDTAILHDLMALLSARAVVYSCGVGHRDPVALPALLQELSHGAAHHLEILIHDYFPVSPSYTLLDSDGVYRGVPAARHTDPAHSVKTTGGATVGLHAWRAAWGAAMQAADHVTVFSQNSAGLMLEAYPEIEPQLRVAPHSMLYDVPVIAGGEGRRTAPPVIGVLGNIGAQKGARILQELSRHLARTKQARLVVIGNMDPAFALTPPAQVHGSYMLSDVPGLVAKYGITDWLMPSVWPETFSYAVHEVIATGMPVWAFDLGAQGDAARETAKQRGQGGIVPLDLKAPQFAPMLDLMFKDVKGAPK